MLCRNEAGGIGVLADALVLAGDSVVAAGQVARWEAILVDDGSTDGSGRALDDIAARDARFSICHHGSNQGVGRAMRTGFSRSVGGVVVYTDADLPFDLAALPGLLGPVVGGDVDLIAGRRVGRAREGRGRAVRSVAYNLLVRALFRLPLSDVNFACKVASRAAVAVPLSSRGGFIDAEWLLSVRRLGLRIEEVPVAFVPRRWGSSSMDRAQVVATVRDLLAFRLGTGRGRSGVG